jgi:uncharacterized protein DUF3467
LKNDKKRVTWDESDARNVYANVAQVKATRDEVMLLFGASQTGQADQNDLRVQLNERIVLNPIAAKRLAIQLNKSIQAYESSFGFLGEKAVLREKLKPTPPLRPPIFRSAKGTEKVALLFQFLKDQKVEPAFERSCGFLAKTLLGNRFLLGFEKSMIERNPDEKITGVCARMNMPQDFLAAFLENLPEANIVGFGFGEHGGACTIKAYLEFGARFYRAVKSKPHSPEPYLSHLGFKWDAEDNTRKALARYTCFLGYTNEEMQERLSDDFYWDKAGGPFETVKGILDLASSKVSKERFLYLDVKEENNPRSSFDINVYGANLQLQEAYPFLLHMCRHYSIPEKQFLNFYDPAKTHILGHLAGGMDREGRDFLTLYYGE